MKGADVVEHLKRKLPLVTALFSDEVAIASIVHAGTTATVTTSTPHGLAVGQNATIFGARTPVAVASITHGTGEAFAVVTTSEDHDLTLYRTFTAGNVVEVAGAVEAAFQGVREVVAVKNRRTLHIKVDPAAPAAATGTIKLLGASNYFRNVRGLYAVVTVVSPTVFTVTHDAATNLGTLTGPAFLRTPPRITGAVSDEAASHSYRQEFNAGAKPWAYVVLDPVEPIRDRGAPSESYAVNVLSAGWSQNIAQRFRVLVFLSSAAQERGRLARDTAEDLFGPLCRAILGATFPTGLSSPSPSVSVNFAGHGPSGEQPAGVPVYAHEYAFEQLASLSMSDTVGNEEHVAFRDIALELGNNVGASTASAAIDLDEVPL